MEVKILDKKNISDFSSVDVTYSGNVVKIQHLEKRNNSCSIRLIDKDHYIYLGDESGEVFECDHISNRSEGLSALRVSMQKLRDIINCNTTDISCCRWVTITYRENMQDPQKLYLDVKKLIMRVQYKFGKFEYIHVAEPQGRGAWHLHCLWIFPQSAPYISQKWLSECWGFGDNVKVKKLDANCDNLGSYLTAYLCDVDFENATIENLQHIQGVKVIEVENEKGEKVKKSILKGARLIFYPPKMNLFRCSRGIKRPIKEHDNYKNAKEKISSAKLTYSNCIQVSDGTGFENVITKEFYNFIR